VTDEYLGLQNSTWRVGRKSITTGMLAYLRNVNSGLERWVQENRMKKDVMKLN
jgi:hypothetical protein